jgi:hypothetical protein
MQQASCLPNFTNPVVVPIEKQPPIQKQVVEIISTQKESTPIQKLG